MGRRAVISGDDFYDDEITSGLDPIESRHSLAEAAAQERELHRQEALILWERRQNGELTEAQYQRKLLDIGKADDDLTREP